MKLEHLIEAYKNKDIDVKVKNMSDDNERAGVIAFNNNITASYLLDDEDIVVVFKLFCNCLAIDDLTLSNQLSHTINTLKVMQSTLALLCGTSIKECNIILNKLGCFDGTFKQGKQIKDNNYVYKIQAIDGLLELTIAEADKIIDNKTNNEDKSNNVYVYQ